MGPRSPHASGHAAVGVCRVDVFRAITSTCWSRWQIVCGRYNDLMVLWWSIKMEWRRWKLLISFAHRFYLPNGLGGVGKIMFFIIGDFSPAIDWRPVQGVPCLRPKSAGIGSSPPATLQRIKRRTYNVYRWWMDGLLVILRMEIYRESCCSIHHTSLLYLGNT